jgi:hypothetical protein
MKHHKTRILQITTQVIKGVQEETISKFLDEESKDGWNLIGTTAVYLPFALKNVYTFMFSKEAI